MEVDVVGATGSDIDFIAGNARGDDRIEVYAASGREITDALNYTFDLSAMSWCGKVNDVPVVVFGVAPDGIFGESAQPWMVGTDDLVRYQVPFLRRCCYYVNIMQASFPYLHNWVDERNVVAQRWLKWMGFSVEGPKPFGPFGDDFRHFKLGDRP